MPTPHGPALGDTRRPTPTRPPRRSGDRNGPPRVRSRLRALLRAARPPHGPGGDRGAAFVEVAAVTLLVAAIILAVYQLELSRTFNESVRQMVCLVEGPGCGGATWVEDQRPEEPSQYEWTGDSSNSVDNQAIGLSQAEGRGWTGQEWDCLDNLWSNVSGWDHTFVHPDTGAVGVPGFLAGQHGAMPPEFAESASAQIAWGIDHIDQAHGTPCNAWSYWQGTGSY
ncbi:hypothetical protein ACIBFB_04655 [Nocardiopsis sp. NPDC050513]|uniref:aggregation-promoting factor C-terminal-like domain-containing protein n=1 Tax=Nocardiopsis sp. NPDC050513 TaxID=3364338 RepID=UPI0037B2A666